MSEQQLKDLYIGTDYGIFKPIYTYIDFIFNEETQEHEYIGLEIQKTAQEVYQEWLENKDKPIIQEPSLTDKISILEADVTAQTLENQAQASDISANTEMIFMTMDAATELNESGLQNTQMVLVSMDALTEINEQLILLQEEVTKLKGGIL